MSKRQINEKLSNLHPQTTEVVIVGLIVILSLLYLS